MNMAPKSNNLGVLGKVSVNFRRVPKVARLEQKPIKENEMKEDVRPMTSSEDRYPKA